MSLNKLAIAAGFAVALLGGTTAALAGPVVGVADTGNCYPGLCNDSGTSVGQSIDYQQVYAASAFSGITSIDTITLYFAPQFSGSSFILAGDYSIYLGYTSAGVNGLSSTLASNVLGSESLFLTTHQTGVTNSNPSVDIAGTSFVYNPGLGNLLLEIVASNQTNLPNNGTGAGFFQADDRGTVTSRAYCITGQSCTANSVGLVTGFNVAAVNAVPEPVTLSLFGAGLAGVAAFARRRRKH